MVLALNQVSQKYDVHQTFLYVFFLGNAQMKGGKGSTQSKSFEVVFLSPILTTFWTLAKRKTLFLCVPLAPIEH